MLHAGYLMIQWMNSHLDLTAFKQNRKSRRQVVQPRLMPATNALLLPESRVP